MCKGECSKDNFFFSNVEPWRLYSPEYGVSKGWNVFYLVWRWINALFFLASLIESPLVPQHADPIKHVKWLIYMTNWTAIVYTIGQVWNACVVTVEFASHSGLGPKVSSSGGNEETSVAWYMKVNWIVYTISLGASNVVVILFWALLYSPDNGALTYDDYAFHLVVGVNILLIDMWITAMPLSLPHVYLTWIYGLVWVLFGIIYEVAGGTSTVGTPNIYEILDWTEKPGTSGGMIAGIIILAMVIHFAGFGLYKLRVFIYSKRCYKNVVQPLEKEDLA